VIFDQHGRAIPPLSHDLKRSTTCATLQLDPNKLVTEFVHDGADQFFDLFAQNPFSKAANA
jgi:hypothetical protein